MSDENNRTPEFEQALLISIPRGWAGGLLHALVQNEIAASAIAAHLKERLGDVRVDHVGEVKALREPVAPAPTVEPVDAGDIAERLEALNLEQLKLVASAFSEPGDDEASLRRNLTDYIEHWANEAADDARAYPEVAREAGRREALGFLAEEIATATASAPPLSEQISKRYTDQQAKNEA